MDSSSVCIWTTVFISSSDRPSRSSACNIIAAFVDAVNLRIDNVKFPTGIALASVKQGFFQKCGIPNTIGAIDGTLIPIIAPAANEAIYVCRKGFHAINVQAVVDHKARFIDIVSKWPGSTHDASAFDSCGLKTFLEEHHQGHLLGDSGYPLKKYLLTPLLRPTTDAELRYNYAQSSGRMVVERAFGVLKSRFRCLHKTGGCLYMRPDKCCQVVAACMRLHNLCVDLQVPLPEEPIEEADDVDHAAPQVQNDRHASAYRQQIIHLFM
ncbi:putative nuclease HARBI1 [Dreissena polymorpha]|uniref:putative nuclease HARBI1 n=1 Tax=Dreissena polymorpha TaxID=45954 RepID=UPI00226509EC|nr:putative nuclease HARBI1 [Dreissena polymorpha]